MFRKNFPVRVLCLALSTAALAQQAGAHSPKDGLLQGSLTKLGGPPFHLRATINDRDGGYSGNVEMFWVNPTKWRRTINSHMFSQTLVVSGTQVFEQDSDDYFPPALQTLITAMVDPQSLLDTLLPDEKVLSHANGGAKPPLICEHFNPRSSPGMEMLCHVGPYKDMESISGPVHGVAFVDYRDFNGMKVARFLIKGTLTARVTELTELADPDSKTFSIDAPTPPEKRLRTVVLQESELRSRAMQPLEIIWPQVLDGATTGPSSYYVSIDHGGGIRDTVILKGANERANEPAIRQIEKWKFKPETKDGAPVQVEGILTFTTDTRAWGPADPLSDSEVRKLASNISDPIFPPGTASGAFCNVRIAIDEEGNLIEAISGEDSAPGMFAPCYQAIKMWVFHPILENGQPRPLPGRNHFPRSIAPVKATPRLCQSWHLSASEPGPHRVVLML